MSKYPENLQQYYRNNPDLFELRTIGGRNFFYLILAAAILFIAMSSLIPLGTTLTRIIAEVVLACSLGGFLLGSKNVINKKSGSILKEIRIKKFETASHSEEEKVDAFIGKYFLKLSNFTEADNRPIQAYILRRIKREKCSTFNYENASVRATFGALLM